MAAAAPTAGGGGANPQEVRELKIKLSHREKEIRELTQKLRDNEVFLKRKDAELKEAEKERDALSQKCEAMLEQLKSNNVEFNEKAFEPKDGGAAPKGSLLEQYKAKLAKAQKELEARLKEIQERDSKLVQLRTSVDRNDRLLRKHVAENQSLKK